MLSLFSIMEWAIIMRKLKQVFCAILKTDISKQEMKKMARTVIIVILFCLLIGCTEAPYEPEMGLDYFITSWVQTGEPGAWGDTTVQYSVYNIGTEDLKDVRLRFELLCSNSSYGIRNWSPAFDLDVEEMLIMSDSFTCDGLQVTNARIISIGMSKPDTNESSEGRLAGLEP